MSSEPKPPVPPPTSVVERRSGDRRDRRAAAPPPFKPEALPDDPAMSDEQFLFVSAIEAFKRRHHKNFPTWTDVLEVVRTLGYRKTKPSELKLDNVTDWTEVG